ncbi:hypothetical protein B0H13DRAFT_1878708 [Mycena leptocephala]|nr:hypothetical protein B0H13DRAFT_1878708 [Mycena leptocephala]
MYSFGLRGVVFPQLSTFAEYIVIQRTEVLSTLVYQQRPAWPVAAVAVWRRSVLAKSDPEYALGDTFKGCILSVTGTTDRGLFDGTWTAEVVALTPESSVSEVGEALIDNRTRAEGHVTRTYLLKRSRNNTSSSLVHSHLRVNLASRHKLEVIRDAGIIWAADKLPGIATTWALEAGKAGKIVAVDGNVAAAHHQLRRSS